MEKGTHIQIISNIFLITQIHLLLSDVNDSIDFEILRYILYAAGDSNVSEDLSRIVISLCGLLAMTSSMRKSTNISILPMI